MKGISHIITAVIALGVGFSLGNLGTYEAEESPLDDELEVQSLNHQPSQNERVDDLLSKNEALEKELKMGKRVVAELEKRLDVAQRTLAMSEAASEETALESSGNSESDLEAETEVEAEETASTPLLESLMKLKNLDGGRRMEWRVGNRVREVFEGEDVSEEQRDKAKEMLKTFYEASDDLNMLVLDLNVPAEEVISKIQSLHEETLNKLSLEVETGLARELLGSSNPSSNPGADALQGTFRRMELSEEQMKALETAAAKVAGEVPALAVMPSRRGGSTNLGPDATWEDVQQRREFVEGVDSLSALMEKSNQMTYEGRKQMIGSLEGDPNFDEETLQKMNERAEQSLDRSQRGVMFIRTVESDPDVLKGMMKLRESMGGAGRR